MHIKLFAVGGQPIDSALILRANITAAFRSYSRNLQNMLAFSSFSEMAPSLNLALKDSDIIAIFVGLDVFAKSKELFIKAMHLDAEYRFDVFEKIEEGFEDISMTSPEVEFHINFPVGAEIFLTDDGLYSGFCISSQNQKIYFLPYDDVLSPKLLKTSVNISIKSFFDEVQARQSRIRFIHNDICSLLAEAGVQVAVAKTPASHFFVEAGKGIDGFNRYFLLYDDVSKREKTAVDKHTIKLAIEASRRLDCPYGIAVSNIVPTQIEGEHKIYFALAGKKTFSTACLNAKFSSGETWKIEDFFMQAINSVVDILKKRLYDENSLLKRNL